MASRSSIAGRIFVLVFGFSLAWFTLTTAFQMVFEYRNTRIEVDSNLVDLFWATRDGLESGLWNYDLALIRGSLDSTRSIHFLSGAQVKDEAGALVASWGDSPSSSGLTDPAVEQNVGALTDPLFHRFTLFHRDSKGTLRSVGTLVLVTGFDVLGARLADSIRLIGINFLATTLGLLVILLVVLTVRVARPLGQITKSIEGYRFDRDLPTLARPLKHPDELSVLWKSFESLTGSLKESWLQQRIMAAILEEAAVMALVCDGDGRVISSNAQARLRLAGSQPGGALSRLSYGDDPAVLLGDVSQLLAEGKAWRGEVKAANDRGQTFWLSAALLPLSVVDEPRARWGVMIEDVSAKKLTEVYRQERDLAQQATRAKGLFLANLSHEIRTPMNAVVGLTALALDQDVSPQVREYLSQLERSGAALLGIINDILDFSKLEEGKVHLVASDFRVATLLESVEAISRFRAEAKGLEFVLTVSPVVPGVVRGDELRVRQVLLNLVTNAVKFTETGRVSVLVAVRGDRLRFEVSDTGIGISPADQGRLFQSFTQVDSSATRRYGGTGLGLAISRQLVTLMDGALGVESTLGQGSLFWFEVPLVVGKTVEPTVQAQAGLAGLRVLLAEDNKVNQLVAKEILRKAGIQPTVVANGEQAVEKVGSEPFDLVLMDLQMPVMDGLEATRIIRKFKDAATLPILAMTAHTVAQERDQCLEAGMQDLIPKPVAPDALFEALSRWRPGGPRT